MAVKKNGEKTSEKSPKAFNIKEFFEVKLNKNLAENPEQMDDFNCVYQFEIDDGVWNLDLTVSSPKIKVGKHKEPDCTIKMSGENFEKLMRRNLNVPMALITGKIKIVGEKALALRLNEILS